MKITLDVQFHSCNEIEEGNIGVMDEEVRFFNC